MTRTDADFEGFTRLHGVDADLSQDGSMEEGVTGPIREFDKSEALVGIEPFDEAVDWRTFERLAELGSGAESTGLWVIGISVEVATPRMPKILISQLWFLVGTCPISRIERLGVALLPI